MATRTRTAPAKKSVASRRPAAPAKKAVPAKKSAPAKKAPAKKPIVEAPASLPKTAPTRPKISAHDVLRAHLDMVQAQQVFAELHSAYWNEYGVAVDLAVDHSKAVLELDAPKRKGGPASKDGLVRRATVEEESRIIGETFDREDLEKHYSLVELRELFKDLLTKDDRLTPTLKKIEILSQLEENGYFREEVDADSDEADDEEEEAIGAEGEDEEYDEDEDDSDDSDDDSEDDDEGDDEEEGELLTAEDLDEYNLAELREVAEENSVLTKGKKEAALRAELKEVLFPDAVEDEDEEDEEEDDDDEDEGYLTVEDLQNMSLEELQSYADRTEDKCPAATYKSAVKLRKWLEDYVDNGEDDDEE